MPRRSSPARVLYVVAGSLAALAAAGLLTLGGLALWADGEKDRDGYITTHERGFSTTARALATENMDIDLDGVDWIMDTNDFGKVRLEVESQTGKPVFVGIARSSDVSDYLRGVSHATLTDVDYSPFSATYRPHDGDRRPGRPARRDFWDVSTQGTGTQTLTWDVRDGDWQVVVMNADGSPGVWADVSAGAKAPFLSAVGWSSLGGGVVLLLASAGLIALGMRERRPAAPAPAPEAAAA